MRPLAVKEVCEILMQYGFIQVRQRGSHIIMQKQEGGRTRTVPVPNHKELRVVTLRSIIRQSGLAKEVFE